MFKLYFKLTRKLYKELIYMLLTIIITFALLLVFLSFSVNTLKIKSSESKSLAYAKIVTVDNKANVNSIPKNYSEKRDILNKEEVLNLDGTDFSVYHYNLKGFGLSSEYESNMLEKSDDQGLVVVEAYLKSYASYASKDYEDLLKQDFIYRGKKLRISMIIKDKYAYKEANLLNYGLFLYSEQEEGQLMLSSYNYLSFKEAKEAYNILKEDEQGLLNSFIVGFMNYITIFNVLFYIFLTVFIILFITFISYVTNVISIFYQRKKRFLYILKFSGMPEKKLKQFRLLETNLIVLCGILLSFFVYFLVSLILNASVNFDWMIMSKLKNVQFFQFDLLSSSLAAIIFMVLLHLFQKNKSDHLFDDQTFDEIEE